MFIGKLRSAYAQLMRVHSEYQERTINNLSDWPGGLFVCRLLVYQCAVRLGGRFILRQRSRLYSCAARVCAFIKLWKVAKRSSIRIRALKYGCLCQDCRPSNRKMNRPLMSLCSVCFSACVPVPVPAWNVNAHTNRDGRYNLTISLVKVAVRLHFVWGIFNYDWWERHLP